MEFFLLWFYLHSFLNITTSNISLNPYSRSHNFHFACDAAILQWIFIATDPPQSISQIVHKFVDAYQCQYYHYNKYLCYIYIYKCIYSDGRDCSPFSAFLFIYGKKLTHISLYSQRILSELWREWYWRYSLQVFHPLLTMFFFPPVFPVFPIAFSKPAPPFPFGRLRANTINCNIDKIHRTSRVAHGSRPQPPPFPKPLPLASPPFTTPSPRPCPTHSLIRCPRFMGAASFVFSPRILGLIGGGEGPDLHRKKRVAFGRDIYLTFIFSILKHLNLLYKIVILIL